MSQRLKILLILTAASLCGCKHLYGGAGVGALNGPPQTSAPLNRS